MFVILLSLLTQYEEFSLQHFFQKLLSIITPEIFIHGRELTFELFTHIQTGSFAFEKKAIL